MNEQLVQNPETLHEPTMLDQLRQERMQHAQAELADSLRRHAEVLNRIAHPHVALTQAGLNGFGYDEASLSPANLMAFEAIGFDAEYMLAHTADGAMRQAEKIPEVTYGSLAIKTEQYAQGVSLQIQSADVVAEDDYEHLKTAVSERFAASPAYQQLKQLAERAQLSDLPSKLETDWFPSDQDALGSLTFLLDTGFLSDSHYVVQSLRAGKVPTEIIAEALRRDSQRYITESETDGVTRYGWGGALEHTLSVDQNTGAWKYALSTHADMSYPEAANQMPSAESIPFIETECARDILTWAESAGVALAPAIRWEMTRAGQADRFGSVYTQLSRELAKWVDNPDRIQPTNLFVLEADQETEYTSADQAIAAKLTQVDTSKMSEPAALLFDIARQALTRTNTESDLPVTREQIDIKDGACFDVFTYYVAAARGEREWGANNWLHETTINAVRMLEKTHGNHTFLSTSDMQFNGVKLPKGALFQKAADGGFAFQRLTPFVFDTPADQAVFGSEISKTYEAEKETVRRIGGATLRNLIVGARR